MEAQNRPSPWVFFALIAFVLALIAASLITADGCDGSTTDQCLMSKGFFPYVLGVLFLILLPVIGAVAKAVQGSNKNLDT